MEVSNKQRICLASRQQQTVVFRMRKQSKAADKQLGRLTGIPHRSSKSSASMVRKHSVMLLSTCRLLR